jgi:hypothetical protein
VRSSTAALAAASILVLTAGGQAEEHALRFAPGQLVTLPAFQVPTAHTIELWLRPREPLADPMAPVSFLSLGGVAAIELSRAGIDYRLDLGRPSPLLVSAGKVEAGRWRHVAASFDGRRMRLFLDGRLVNVRIAIGEVAFHPGASGRLGGGGSAGSQAGTGFAGEIDEVRWWSRARSEEDIASDYRQKLKGDEPGLTGYWSLDEGAGQVALDASGSRRHGILGSSRFRDSQDPAWEDSSSPTRRPDPDYLLRFDPPGPLSTRSGEEFEVSCLLSSPGGPGEPLLAWSISVRHDRLLHFLVSAGMAGTSVQPYLKDGFSYFESIDGESGTGFIARGIIDETGPVLSASGPISVARATYRSLSPRGEDQAQGWIRFEEGLEGIAGLARNMFRIGSREIYPLESALSVSIRSPEVVLSFAEEAGLKRAPGREFAASCLLTVAQNPGVGAQSWSISVQHDPQVLEIVGATTSGTVVEQVTAQTSVFQITELVDNKTGAGFLSAVILSIEKPFSLPPNGEARIARARYRVREGVAPGTTTGIAYRDGLQQSGVAIDNLVVFQAGPTAPRTGLLPVRVVAETFVRGDLNGDRRLNMADVVMLLVWLFADSSTPGCLEAADLNDDGRIDVADPVFLLGALYQGSRSPPPPFPLPGPDPTPDALGCDEPVE